MSPQNAESATANETQAPEVTARRPLSDDDKIQLVIAINNSLSAQARDELLRRLGEHHRTLRFLVIFTLVSVAAVAAGILADNTVFWSVAATVYLFATAALVFYAAKGIGVLSEVLHLAGEPGVPSSDFVPALD